ncbi:hypothetical protein TGRUB_306200 [Toxoplasma gondii RUB]|uniref:Uncharacterized protein n=8 Tax=Toxoplasma gondii TaxID=5811 RepID=S7UI95_TOXGG|nr:hypothetical protein TGGT1_306200 [Toxoplasma gondii GT1]KAF4644771.1 hypothetical protein TGRH88_017650 [Toxoplasma gondii]KFG30306.1 hypothetical protein TGP89_306200 [Toxoplasma gondii p89]KFG33479.1 hypothetical protein TGDOM2_306200 [Toxoplasma gondii GAB2-2007-GAL-DOM2]KFG45020.1 hypothetical protein TGFOU_306200 [Toxoplasma gondii FOU]KFG59325.1 hypothetical protein TGRUB_306200 [Toxoplasma gondii RUB]KFH02689.1 hypothetical protein TGVAND_306200 [Toxoplasma gondii VAND]RQX67958.1 
MSTVSPISFFPVRVPTFKPPTPSYRPPVQAAGPQGLVRELSEDAALDFLSLQLPSLPALEATRFHPLRVPRSSSCPRKRLTSSSCSSHSREKTQCRGQTRTQRENSAKEPSLAAIFPGASLIW